MSSRTGDCAIARNRMAKIVKYLFILIMDIMTRYEILDI